jgi:ribosomal protein L11 methyltransferase
MSEAALMHIITTAIADPIFREDLFAHPQEVAAAYALDKATTHLLLHFTPGHLESFVGSLVMHQVMPIRASARFVVIPEQMAPLVTPPQLPIILGPDLVFGNGSHASTRLCLAALERHGRPGMRVLDLGTGTGILAIGAARLGAAEVLALDVDPLAVRAAASHAALNGVAGSIRTEEGSVEQAAGFAPDLILANLLAPILIKLAPALAGLVEERTLLIASGLRVSEGRPVMQALRRAGLRVKVEGQENGWLVLKVGQPTRLSRFFSRV